MGSRQMKRKVKMHKMIIGFNAPYDCDCVDNNDTGVNQA